MMRPEIINKKVRFISLVFLTVLVLVPLNYINAVRNTLDSSAHDLSNETTTVSCLNCHWMHHNGSDAAGAAHSLVASETRYVCFICHGGFDPNQASDLSDYGVNNLSYKLKHRRYNTLIADYDTVPFPGQLGVNIFNVKSQYDIAAAAGTTASYHMFYGTKYGTVDVGTFTCFGCHNHGIYDTSGTYPGGRLPKLLWSNGSGYDSFEIFSGSTQAQIKAARKDINEYYATEYFCLSCHSSYGFPDTFYGSWDSSLLTLDAAAFMLTKHSYLDRYGTTGIAGVPQNRNSFGTGKDISCLVCHTQHASTYPKLMRGNFDQNTMCLQCHLPDTAGVRDSTYAFTFQHESTLAVNYITTGHKADKSNFAVLGHGREYDSGGPGLVCSNCHGVHGTGHYKMVRDYVVDPRYARGDTTYDSDYTLSTAQIYDLDSLQLVSGFCLGACHKNASPDNYDTWWYISMATSGVLPMPSYAQGAALFESSSHKGVYNSAYATNFAFYELKDCGACHDSHGTVNKALLWGTGEELCFQCHADTTSNDTTVWGAPNIERYFNTTKKGISHHPIDSSEQNDSSAVECINCHNPHLANSNIKTVYPYDWSVPSDSASQLHIDGAVGAKDHENRAIFCATCHSTAFPDSNKKIIQQNSSTWVTVAVYPPGVKLSPVVRSIGDKWFRLPVQSETGIQYSNSGHLKNSQDLIDCINCHSPHGSNNPFNVRSEAYLDPIDNDAENFVDSVYTNFTDYGDFYNQNTLMSRKFCYSVDGTSGCHTPQYLTSRVVFPGNAYNTAGNDSTLGVDTSHHDSRNVPFGPRGSSYYIDEHDPYWDTNLVGDLPPTGVVGCPVCHYDAHNPTPNYWYESSAQNQAQFCLNCHHPADSTYSSVTAKFNGGAPTQYESTYIDFVSDAVYPLSTTYVSKHITNAGVNSATSGYCKQCHGEHVNTGLRSDQYHDLPSGTYIASPDTSLGYGTEYVDGQSFCLQCHRGAVKFASKIAPDLRLYETSGHGRMGRGDTSSQDITYGIKVYCFDCHAEHSSQNPYLIRTKIRKLIEFSTVSGVWETVVSNRDIRAEDLDTGFSTFSVQVDGYQYVCFACHSQPGVGRDSSAYMGENGVASDPGTGIWLGQAVYESSGHGSNWIAPYRDTTYGLTANGLKCSWCHEPHGRVLDTTNTTAAWNTTYLPYATDFIDFNNNMLKIAGGPNLCFKCHNQALNDTVTLVSIGNIKGQFDSAVSKHDIDDTTGTIKINCINCHNPHTGNKNFPVVVSDQRNVMNPGNDTFCLTCHDGTPPTFAAGSPGPDVVFPVRSSSGEAFTGFDKSDFATSEHGVNGVYCRTCHKPHGTNKLKLIREVFDFNQDNVIGGHSYDSVYNTTVYGSTDQRIEDICFGCHRNHDSDTDWNTAWVNIPDVLQFYKNYDTASSTYVGYTMSHHRIFSFEQIGPDTTWGTSDDMRVECYNCHNQHMSSQAQPLTDPDNPGQIMGAWGDELISFCLRCHDNDPPYGILGLTDELRKNIASEYTNMGNNPPIDGVYQNFTGHYRQRDGKPFECRMCHHMHGSNFAKQIQEATDTTYDTFKMMRNMRQVALPSSNPLSAFDTAGDTLIVSSVTEVCLSCHSGKTQFYDRDLGTWNYIPLPPPLQSIDTAFINVSVFHPALLDTNNIYTGFADTGGVRKIGIKSVYSSVYNINDSTINPDGCDCHGAHNPFMASTSEFSDCFNCHNAYAGIPDIETPFDSAKFLGDDSPMVSDDNTVLLLHLDGIYEGVDREQPYTDDGTYGLIFASGKYSFGASFETSFNTTKLVYPTWTIRSSGDVGESGIDHDSTADLTIRFTNDANDEDDGKGRYLTSLDTATGITYGEGYIPNMTGAAYLDNGATLIYRRITQTAIGGEPNRTNFDNNQGTFEAWVWIDLSGTGIQDTTADRYLFWVATNTVEPFKNSIFVRHSRYDAWDIGVSDETGVQFNIVSAPDNLTYGWHHIAATWKKNDAQLKIYIDGQLAASEGAFLFPYSNNSTFRIGSSSIAGTSINTYIDEVQVSKLQKTDAEILDDYNGLNQMNFNARRGTLELWVRPYWDGNDSVSHGFFENYYDTNNYFRLEKDSTNVLRFTMKGRGNPEVSIYSTVNAASLPNNTWSHISASWEDFGVNLASMNLYLGSTLVASTETATVMGYTDTSLYFGTRKDMSNPVWAVLDDIWITDIMQSPEDISLHTLGYSNVSTGSTPSPTESYLPDPSSLGLILHYDTSYDGENAETPVMYSGVSLTSAKFDSGISIDGTDYISYLSGEGYQELSGTAGLRVNNFNSTFGSALESTGVAFTNGFLGSGAVTVDSNDILSYGFGISTNGLVAYWQMEEGISGTIYDTALSDGAQNGTLTGASWVSGNSGYGLNFNGSNQYVNCGSPSNFDFGAGNFTVSGWIKPTALKNYAGIVSKVVSTRGGTYSWMFVSHGNGSIGYYTPNNGWRFSNTGVVAAGNWYFATWVRNGAVLSFYVNGIYKGGYSAFSYSDNTAHNVFLGSWYSPSTIYDFNGVIDEVSIYNRALDTSEINQLYTFSNSGSVRTAGTIQTWAFIDSAITALGANRYIFRTSTDSTTSKNQIALYHGASNDWIFHTSDSTGTNYTVAAVPDNMSYGWHNFAATWDTSAIKLYIDGKLETSVVNPYLPNVSPSKYYLGSGGQTNTHINTELDEFLFDNTAKTQSSIRANILPSKYSYNAVAGTIEMWMKPINWDSNEVTDQHYLFDAHNNDTSKDRIALYYDTTKEIKFDVYSSTGVLRRAKFDVSTLMDSTTFRHYAGTWNEYNVNLYINGVLVGETTSTAVSDNRAAGLFIGSNGFRSGQADAVIDEVRIFDTLRSAEAILADAGDLLDYKQYFANSFDPYEGGSRHPMTIDVDAYESSGRQDVSKLECLKCHLQMLDTATIMHRGGVVDFVDVNTNTSWVTRIRNPIAPDNSSKVNVTLFCLSCHMNPKADPLDTAYYGSIDSSPYRFTADDAIFGGDPVQLKALVSEMVVPKPGGGYYYPIDTAGAHFDTFFGGFGGLSCTDCHDPHGSINKMMLQDFEEAKEGRDYNRDGIMTREIQYFDKENVRLYQLNEEKFCFFCHGGVGPDKGRFNSTGINQGRLMKDIEAKFANSDAHHMVDDEEQAANNVSVECTNCHNPHTAKRDAVVLNQQTGERAYVTATDQMNNFCLGCHGDTPRTSVIPTSWNEGVKFPGAIINQPNPEWTGNKWNKFNKGAMASGNKHFSKVKCATCHDPHGTSNYRMLNESIVKAYEYDSTPATTTSVYGLQLMLTTKPDGRRRYDVYSTMNPYDSTPTNYSINRVCFSCHVLPKGYDEDYPSTSVYPGKVAFEMWDFGTTNSADVNRIKYDSISNNGYSFLAPDIYGKSKDCNYCHNPHSSDSTRIHMVRDSVPLDLDRNSPDYGSKIESGNWFQDGFPATGVDFCLSKGCHVTNRFAKLGPRDPLYSDPSMKFWYKPYDQFNLLDHDEPGALTFSGMRADSFLPDGVYTTARVSHHPIVPYNQFINTGNTLICLSCHVPHGSPGNTELSEVYRDTGFYESTYPQDNASLRRAYYRRINWWPMTFWKRTVPHDPSVIFMTLGRPPNQAITFNDLNLNSQTFRYYAVFNTGANNVLNYRAKAGVQNIPLAGNDICFMCHPAENIIGETGNPPQGTWIGIDTTKTRFIGHEVVTGGSRIGETYINGMPGIGLNTVSPDVCDSSGTEFHQFTCSTCHGPHATTNEKLLAMKCFAQNKDNPVNNLSSRPYNGPSAPRPSSYCHPYDNNTGTWNANYRGWRTLIDTTKTDMSRPAISLDSLYVYFNTTGVYDTGVVVPGLDSFYVTSSDYDVVLAWRSVYDSTQWTDHYNIYRGETTITQMNKPFVAKTPINTWAGWGYNLIGKVYDTDIFRLSTQYNTLYTIDPGFAHTLGKRYFYMVVPADSFDNEAIIPSVQHDTAGTYVAYGANTTVPRPVTAMSAVQETFDSGGYSFRMRFTWQDPGDNLFTSTYSLYYALIDSAQYNTAYSTLSAHLDSCLWTTYVLDTSYNTDIVTSINFTEYYGTTDTSITYNSTQIGKIYVFGIKPADNQNNTASLYSIKSIKITDPIPSAILNLEARPNVPVNMTDTTNYQYDVILSWSVPWDNAQPADSIPIYKIYRRLNNTISQNDINTYNLVDTAFTDVVCLTTLTAYNSFPASLYGFGSTITYTDNVAPDNVYYYAVTSIDKYATDAANLADTLLGYNVDRDGWLYREQIRPGYNTKLLDPISEQMTRVRVNAHFSFTFPEADYDTAYFKEYRFYFRYETDNAWTFDSNNIQTTLVHGTSCLNAGCHSEKSTNHWGTSNCTLCHDGNGRGGLDIDTSYPPGDYYFAGSIAYNSARVIIDGRTAWVSDVQTPLNDITMLNVEDLFPPWPLSLNYTLVPRWESGYNSVQLSWSGGWDSNFSHYEVRYKSETLPFNANWGNGSDWVSQGIISTMVTTTWAGAWVSPNNQWQTTYNKFGDFAYTYEVQAWDSANNFSSVTIPISTRPPSGSPNFGFAGADSTEIVLQWNNLYNYSYGQDYGSLAAYHIYGKETTGTINRIFQAGTLILDTGYGIYKLGTVAVIADTTVYPQGNQALGVDATASSAPIPASGANDGNAATFWMADDSYDTFSTTWIQFDLGFTTDAITEIVYNNTYDPGAQGFDSTDTTQGYTILVSPTETALVWETVATKPTSTPRGASSYTRSKNPMRYIKITNFSDYSTASVAMVAELSAFYPTDTSTTSFPHTYDNSELSALPGHSYAYGIYLEDNTGAKSLSQYTNAYMVIDNVSPNPVIDLVAFGASFDDSVRLKWTKPYDDVGTVKYEIWRRYNNPDVRDSTFADQTNKMIDTTGTAWFVDSTITLVDGNPYWYAVCAVDSTGNRSAFEGINYSARAYPSMNKDTIPPEPITITAANYPLKGASRYAELIWSTTAYDRKDFDTAGNIDWTLYSDGPTGTTGVSRYHIYKIDDSTDSTPFANELALLNRNNFDSAGSTGVADGWSAGTWGGVYAPSVVPTIDSTLASPAQKLFIYNYVGDSKEFLTTNTNYIKTAAYIKSTGYALETSYSTAAGYESSTTHYILGLWLKAEGPITPTYIGNVYLDVATNLNTGNESTYSLIARRTLINPVSDWAYYILNFVTPLSGISDSTENGIMIWANNNGNIWMDSAKLILLGQPKLRPTVPYLEPPDYDIIVNHTYHYAVTAVDKSQDGNLYDGFPSNGNEGDFINVGVVVCDEQASYFDTVFDSIYDSVPWLLPSARTNGFKSGTSPTMRFIVGATPSNRLIEQFGSNDRTYDSDNLFRNGDYISLQFRMLDPYYAQPDSTILVGQGGIQGDFSQLDTGGGGYSTNDSASASGYYSFIYRITTNAILTQGGLTQVPDTPYNTTLSMYESLYRVRIAVKDSSGNGPTFSPTESDTDTSDNNPDTTYLVILDNETPNSPY